MTTQTALYTGDEPIGLADAKQYLKVDFDSDDTLISSLISAARKHAEDYLNLKLRMQTVTVDFDEWQSEYFLNGPVVAISSVTAEVAEAEAEVITDYKLNNGGLPARLIMTGDVPDNFLWLTVEYSAGFGTKPLPEDVINAMYHMIGDWYENRGDGARRFPTVSQKLLDLQRVNYFC